MDWPDIPQILQKSLQVLFSYYVLSTHSVSPTDIFLQTENTTDITSGQVVLM